MQIIIIIIIIQLKEYAISVPGSGATSLGAALDGASKTSAVVGSSNDGAMSVVGRW